MEVSSGSFGHACGEGLGTFTSAQAGRGLDQEILLSFGWEVLVVPCQGSSSPHTGMEWHRLSLPQPSCIHSFFPAPIPQFLPGERIPNAPPAHCSTSELLLSQLVSALWGTGKLREHAGGDPSSFPSGLGPARCQGEQALHGAHTLLWGAGHHPRGLAQADSGIATPARLSRTSDSCRQLTHGKDGSCFSTNPPGV